MKPPADGIREPPQSAAASNSEITTGHAPARALRGKVVPPHWRPSPAGGTVSYSLTGIDASAFSI